MSHYFAIAALRGNGLIHSADLNDLGFNARAIARAVSLGQLVRIRRGIYVEASRYAQLEPDGVHRLLVCATETVKGPAVVSHESAAAMHQLPMIGQWPSVVHATAPGAAGGSSSRGIHKHTSLNEPEIVTINGVVVTSLERTLIDVASKRSLVVSTAMIDKALRDKKTSKDALWTELIDAGARPGSKRAGFAIDFADGRSGSEGESLSRARMWELGFEAPQLQIVVEVGRSRFEVDFGWEGVALFGEFDGAIKYTRAAILAGREPGEVVMNEKSREDSIRAETGRSFVRWTWDDAISPQKFERKLAAAGVPRVTRRS